MSIDYSGKMPDLVFKYDEKHVPGNDLPDPQIDPVIPGARIPLKKVGIGPVDLPVILLRRDGESQVLQAEASLYCSLDDVNAKGLNLSSTPSGVVVSAFSTTSSTNFDSSAILF